MPSRGCGFQVSPRARRCILAHPDVKSSGARLESVPFLFALPNRRTIDYVSVGCQRDNGRLMQAQSRCDSIAKGWAYPDPVPPWSSEEKPSAPLI
jgi:hypothetical protein